MKYKKMLSFLVAIAMVLATFASFSTVAAVEGDMDPSVVLNKSAEYLASGKVEITLETYATAEYSSYSEYPDMIFVLDMSGSMLEPVDDTNGDGITDPLLGEHSRYDILVESVTAVINQIHTSEASAKVAFIKYSDNNVSGVYYKVYNPDDSYYIDVDYTGNYPKDALATTQTLFFDLTDDTDYFNALDLVGGNLSIPVVGGTDKGMTINPDGLSRSDKGLTYDWNIINSSPAVPDGSVTIFYSDGYPKQSSTDDSPNLNKAIQTYSVAEDIKGYATTENRIYSMILNGDPVELNNTNAQYDLNHDGWLTIPEFADGISSNTLGGVYVPPGGYSFVIDPGGSYSSDLIAAFETILNKEVSGPDYGVESQVRDYLTEVIELPEVTLLGEGALETDDSVRVYTSAFTGFDLSDNYTFSPTWNELDESDGIVLTVDDTDKGVYVSGFDYTENLCYYDSDADENYGQKLIIVIRTDLIPGFIGGNFVETNTDMSGFYADMYETNPINRFENPTINVPLEYEVDEVDKYVYVTNGACGIEVLADVVSGVFNYYQDDQRLVLGDFTVGNHRNDYVDISYAFYDGDPDDSDTLLGTLSIDAGSATINGSVDGFAQLLDNKTVTVRITVTPTLPGEYPTLTYDIYPEIIVIDPTINLQNSTNFLGEVPAYEDFMDTTISDDGVEWPTILDADYIGCDGTTPLAAATGMPYLDITPVYFGTTTEFDGTYDKIGSPIAGAVIVEAVLDTDVDITDYATYSNPDLAPAEDTDLNKFYLTIVDGEFTIYKTSTEYSSLDPIESNQGFKFMIEQFEGENMDDPVGAKVRTFYVTLDNAEDAKTIKYLEEGFYRVTEVDDWADKYDPDSPTSDYFFVGRDGTDGDAMFYYVNNWYDQNGTGLVDDEVTDDVHQFDFTTKTLTQYPWIGDVAVARNHVIGLD